MARIQVSLRTLLLLMAVLCGRLALANAEFLISCCVLVVVIAVLNVRLPATQWRFLAYGAVAGIVARFVLMLVYVYARLGYVQANAYRESDAIGNIVDSWRHYVIHLGAFVGSAIGLVLYANRHRKNEN
jgi:hypothetical protein